MRINVPWKRTEGDICIGLGNDDVVNKMSRLRDLGRMIT